MEDTERHVRFPPIVCRYNIFNKSPQEIRCPKCGFDIVTRIETETSALQHSFATMLCCFGITILFYWIPYLIPGLKNVYHYCPNCHELVGYCCNDNCN